MVRLGYSDLEQLTQDIYERRLLIESCERFLGQDLSEEARLYAKGKLAASRAMLRDEPKPNSHAIEAYEELVNLARRMGDRPLESFVLAKIECGDPKLGETNHKRSAVRIRKFSEALAVALGVDLPDLDSAITAAKATSLNADDPKLVSFVASAVGMANEAARDDLDKGYQVLINVAKLAQETMYPRVFAIYNRMDKYIRDNDAEALEQAKALIDEVGQLCRPESSKSVPGSDAGKEAVSYDDFVRAVGMRKRKVIREWIDELSKAVQSGANRSELASILERPTKSPSEDGLLSAMQVVGYLEDIKDSKTRLANLPPGTPEVTPQGN